MNLIVHDLSEEDFKKVYPTVPENTEIISDDGKMLACVGCFGCWIKTPGTCVLKDGYENMGKKMCDAEKLITISKVIYGTYSTFIKKVHDRSISRGLPFFEIVNGRGLHPDRYEHKSTEPPVYIFYGENLSDEQKSRVQRILGHEFGGRGETKVIFCNSIDEVAKEVSAL